VRRLQKVLVGDIVFLLPSLIAWSIAKMFSSAITQYFILSFGMLSGGYIYSAYAASWMVKYGIIHITSSTKI
jgi:hypothetical protein